MDCPQGSLNEEQVASYLATHFQALLQEKITLPQVIEQIKQALVIEGTDTVTSAVDAFHLFISQSRGFLAEFHEGCSTIFYNLDPQSVINLLDLLGRAS